MTADFWKRWIERTQLLVGLLSSSLLGCDGLGPNVSSQLVQAKSQDTSTANETSASAELQPATEPRRTLRIVSAGGSVTETLFAVGLGSSIVGVDTTSSFPVEATRLPRVGYLRQLSAEGIVSLAPTLFLATNDAEPRSVLEQLRSAGIAVELVDDTPGLGEARARVLAIGKAVGHRDQAEQLVRSMVAELEPLERALTTVKTKPSVVFIYARGQGSAQVAGQNTSADRMIQLAGGRNAVQGFDGYRPLTAEAVVLADPDFYLLPALGLDSLNGIDGLLTQPGIAQTNAGKAKHVIAIEDSRLLGFGPRVASALRELAAQLHPEIADLVKPSQAHAEPVSR